MRSRTSHRALARAAVLALSFAAVSIAPRAVAAAAEIVVTTEADVVADDGQVSLREAVMAAETDTSVDGSAAGSGADVIRFAESVSTIRVSQSVDALGPTAFVIDTDVTIEGRSDYAVALREDGGNIRLAYVGPAGRLTLRRLDISSFTMLGGSGGAGATTGGGGGGGAGLGGAFYVRGTLELERCSLRQNAAYGGVGGGHSASSLEFGGGGGGGGIGYPGTKGVVHDGGAGGGVLGGAATPSVEGGADGSPGGEGGGGGGAASAPADGAANGGTGGFGGGGGGGSGYRGTPGPAPTGPGGDGADGGFGGGGGGVGAGTQSQPPLVGKAGWGAEDGFSGLSYAGGNGGRGAGMGGVVFLDGGTLVARLCTFYDNTVGDSGHGFGGAIFSRAGTLRLVSCTFDENEAEGRGGSVFVLDDGAAGTFEMTNCLVGGRGAQAEIEGDSTGGLPAPALGGGGFNWIRSAAGFAPAVAVQGDAELSSLRWTYSNVYYVAPLIGGPLIDAGTSAGLAEDARGAPRTSDFANEANGDDGTDIGAVEIDSNLTIEDRSRELVVGDFDDVRWEFAVVRAGFDGLDGGIVRVDVTLPPGVELTSLPSSCVPTEDGFRCEVDFSWSRSSYSVSFRTTPPADPAAPFRAAVSISTDVEQTTTSDDTGTLRPPLTVQGPYVQLRKGRFVAAAGGDSGDLLDLLLESEAIVPLAELPEDQGESSDRVYTVEVLVNGVSVGGQLRLDSEGRASASEEPWTSVDMVLSADKPRLRLVARGTGLAELLGVPDERRGVIPVEIELLTRQAQPGRGERITALVPYRKNGRGQASGRYVDRRGRVAEGRFAVESFRVKGPDDAAVVSEKARVDVPFDDAFRLDEALGPGDTAVIVAMGRARFEIPLSAVSAKGSKLRVRRGAVPGLRAFALDTRRGKLSVKTEPMSVFQLRHPDDQEDGSPIDRVELTMDIRTPRGLVRFRQDLDLDPPLGE